MIYDTYKKLPALSRSWLIGSWIWASAYPRRIVLSALIACSLPFVTSAVGTTLVWSLGFFERHAVALGSPEEAVARSYLSHLGRAPLARYDTLAAQSKNARLPYALLPADQVLEWLEGGPADTPIPGERRPENARGYAISGAAWLAFQQSARSAIGPALSCPYLPTLGATLAWADDARRGPCQAVGHQGWLPFKTLGAFVLLSIAAFWAMMIDGRDVASSRILRWSRAFSFSNWIDTEAERSLTRLERLRLALSMGRRGRRTTGKKSSRL